MVSSLCTQAALHRTYALYLTVTDLDFHSVWVYMRSHQEVGSTDLTKIYNESNLKRDTSNWTSLEANTHWSLEADEGNGVS